MFMKRKVPIGAEIVASLAAAQRELNAVATDIAACEQTIEKATEEIAGAAEVLQRKGAAIAAAYRKAGASFKRFSEALAKAASGMNEIIETNRQ